MWALGNTQTLLVGAELDATVLGSDLVPACDFEHWQAL